MDKRLNILIVDDDEVDRMTVRRAIQSALINANFEEAKDAHSALDAMRRKTYDCVFLDYFLPDSDGLAVLERARMAGILSPIVMLTGHGDERLAVKLMRSGASDYLPKAQLSPEVLAHSISLVTRLHRLEMERRRAEEALKESNDRIVNILESISDAFFAVDMSGRVTYLNRQAEQLLKSSRDNLIGKPIWEQLENFEPWFRHAVEKTLSEGVPGSLEGYYVSQSIWLEVQIYPVKGGISVYFRDISERKRNEERLKYMAHYDALTGLPNRTLLTDRLIQALPRLAWRKRVVAVMFCDLDRFKIVNDTLGHDVGDQLLIEVAERLKCCVREGDTVARLGGDEFVIILTDVAKPEDVNQIAQKIISCTSEPVMLEGHEVYVTASIGISISPADGETPEVLLKQADIAMYRAKQQGKNNYQLYSPSMNTKAMVRLTLESAMRHALERDEFQLYYQPLLDFETNQITGAEALVRWCHPEMGIISPADFLPLAEETGLIIPIGERLLHMACTQTLAWRQAGYDMRIAFNLSDRQFKHTHFTQLVEQTLRNTGLPGEALELELTEDIIMHGASQALEQMNMLCAMGIRLAIDDFGTGYSSLGHLKNFPIHTLKIDRSFVNEITHDQNNAAIVEAILAMAHKLKLNVVAEGVETQEQFDCLKVMGANEMQGYFFSRPIPAADYTKLLATHYARPQA